MKKSIQSILAEFIFEEEGKRSKTKIKKVILAGKTIPIFINAFWTSKQRQAHSLHEISYRACFKAQLPRFFIERLTKESDIVYDPFSGRGTTILEAALCNRNVIANDVNPLSALLSRPRLFIPSIEQIEKRLSSFRKRKIGTSNIDLRMFYHPKTLSEILSLRNKLGKSNIDSWIRMIATNRLTGHSKGFFSVYTLPPNQTASAQSQLKINKDRKQKPEYRNTTEIILRKSEQLMRDITSDECLLLKRIGKRGKFLSGDARTTKKIRSNSVQLTVTSPPFLDIVQYADDNWLRCWFNNIDAEKVSNNVTMSRTVQEWCVVMSDVFRELYRITKKNGYVAFEVGEVRNGKIRLEEYVVQLGIDAGFRCEAIMINQQDFTKTANIWGVSNNTKGTNSNRIVIFRK